MPQTDENCNQVSNPAKLLAAYMNCSGITCAKIIAETLDIPLRTVQRLKLEAATLVDVTSAKDATCAISGVLTDANSAKDAISGVSEPEALACADKTTRTTNELPTEVVIPRVIDSPVAPTIAKPKRLRSQGSRLPADWELPDDWKVWAQVNCFASDERIAIEAANFADYWIAKPSQATSLDWKRTWQKWARKAFSAAGNRRPQFTGSYGAQQPKEPVESLSAMMARMRTEGAFQ